MTLVTKFLGANSGKLSRRSISENSLKMASSLDESEKILEVAGRQAEQMLQRIDLLSKTIQQNIEGQLYGVADDAATKTRASMDTIVKRHNDFLTKLLQSLETQTGQILADARASIVAQTETAIKTIQAEASKKQVEITNSLSEYEKLQKEEIVRKLSAVLPHVVQAAAGRSITLNDHESIIRDALDKAAKSIEW